MDFVQLETEMKALVFQNHNLVEMGYAFRAAVQDAETSLALKKFLELKTQIKTIEIEQGIHLENQFKELKEQREKLSEKYPLLQNYFVKEKLVNDERIAFEKHLGELLTSIVTHTSAECCADTECPVHNDKRCCKSCMECFGKNDDSLCANYDCPCSDVKVSIVP